MKIILDLSTHEIDQIKEALNTELKKAQKSKRRMGTYGKQLRIKNILYKFYHFGVIISEAER